jgi:hypothetical protein
MGEIATEGKQASQLRVRNPFSFNRLLISTHPKYLDICCAQELKALFGREPLFYLHPMNLDDGKNQTESLLS